MRPEPDTAARDTQQPSGPAPATGHATAGRAASQDIRNAPPEHKAAADTGHPGPELDTALARHGDRPSADLRPARLDIQAALQAARRADAIIAAHARDADRAGDDLMRRSQAQAEQDAAGRRSAVRQDPAPSHRARDLELDEPELEAGL